MKCQILFSRKNKKNIISLPSAKNAQRVVKVKLRPLQHKRILFLHSQYWLFLKEKKSQVIGSKMFPLREDPFRKQINTFRS